MTRSDGSRIRARFQACVAAALACVLGAAIAAAALSANSAGSDALRGQILAVNEARVALAAAAQEGGSVPSDQADAALAEVQDALRAAAQERDASAAAGFVLLAVAALVAVGGVAGYLYRSVVAPFLRLETFAARVAEGDLDAPLAYERSNPFGRFAWAFDHLRVQLKRARAAEDAAAEAHKTALASLSHDLRTPLAALRAHAEALQLGIARTPEEQRAYEQLIVRKCDEAAALVEDLLTHALADMERIEVACAPTSAAALVRACAAGAPPAADVSCIRADDALLMADPKRLAQAIDNLLANAAKHAPGARVEVSGVCEGGAYLICVRDFGPGAAPEDLPFLQQRFFRGSNAAERPGAGLGLFIATHLAERMGGSLSARNAEPGLCVTLTVPLVADDAVQP